MDAATRLAREIEVIIRRLRPTSLRRGSVASVEAGGGMGVRIGQDPEPTRVMRLDTLDNPAVNEDVWVLEAGGTNIAFARTATAVTPWTNVTLAAPFSNYDPGYTQVGYRKEVTKAGSFVRLKGLFKTTGGVSGNGLAIMNLPEGHIPVKNHLFPTMIYNASGYIVAVVIVGNNGAVTFHTFATTDTFFAPLDGLVVSLDAN